MAGIKVLIVTAQRFTIRRTKAVADRIYEQHRSSMKKVGFRAFAKAMARNAALSKQTSYKSGRMSERMEIGLLAENKKESAQVQR